GASSNQRNVVGAAASGGVTITGGGSTTIQGNFFGVAADGVTDLNSLALVNPEGYVIHVVNSASNLIGGATTTPGTGTGNIIFNGLNSSDGGITIEGATAQNNVVAGNTISGTYGGVLVDGPNNTI